jgi:LPPG:FO 2-phospho-L-lactate transferase
VRVVVPAGGVGAARFLRGLLRVVPDDAEITVIGNTGDDITLFGLRICPDLDTVMYTLGGGISEERGWGRDGESFVVRDELAAYGGQPVWFGLGDKDLATHLVRSSMLAAGTPLSVVTAALCERWRPGVRLLPMTDDQVETHVVIERASGPDPVHFQEYWVRLHAEPTVIEVRFEGAAEASPAPGVVAAIAQADVVVLPPSNPVVSIGPVLSVPGVRDALTRGRAPIVGVSPIIGGAPVRGMADKLLPAIGVDVAAAAVAEHYGARTRGGLLDGWLVDVVDSEAVTRLTQAGMRCRAVPLLMTDAAAAAAIAGAALEIAFEAPR